MSIEQMHVNSSHQEMSEALLRDGAIIIEQAMPEDRILEAETCFAQILESVPYGEGLFVGRKTRRIGELFRRSGIAKELATHPTILAVLNQVLLPNCDRYQLHITQAISIDPGERAQVLHRDQAMYVHMPPLDGECMVNVMWPLTPFTKANGATRVIPGSNKWADIAELPCENLCVTAEMKPGSALLYTGSVIHGGGANCSNKARTGLVMGYSLGWLRQYENQYLAVPPMLARHLSKDLQELLGYAVHRPNLGTWALRDPMEILAKGSSASKAAQDFLRPEEEAQLNALLQTAEEV